MTKSHEESQEKTVWWSIDRNAISTDSGKPDKALSFTVCELTSAGEEPEA